MSHAEATGETILAVGAIGSPQILQLSGIGPAALLREHGIAVRVNLPGVGENMQDHWQIRCAYKVKNTVTMNEWVGNPLRRYAMGAYYTLTRRGPGRVPRRRRRACARHHAAQDRRPLHGPAMRAGEDTTGPCGARLGRDASLSAHRGGAHLSGRAQCGRRAGGYKTIKRLAASPLHIIPGHDPKVLELFPAARAGLEGWVVCLDADPC